MKIKIKIPKSVVSALRLLVILVVMGVSSFAGWELTQSWAGAWMSFVIVGYLLDIKIAVDDLNVKGKRMSKDDDDV